MLHCFGDIVGFCAIMTPPLLHPDFKVLPLDQTANVRSTGAFTLS